MRRQQKHINNPEQIGYKKEKMLNGYVIKNYTLIFNIYWGDYTLIVDDLGFGVSAVLYGNHEPIELYRDK
jgi:hypothetical protein